MNNVNYLTYDEAKEMALKLSKETSLAIYVHENPFQQGYILTHFAAYDDEPCAVVGNWVDRAEDDLIYGMYEDGY